MEIINNFCSIYCFISFILGGCFMLVIYAISTIGKDNESKNKVHFYVARDKSDCLHLHIGKPFRDDTEFYNKLKMYYRLRGDNFKCFGLNEKDYANLKWEDEPVEVFINLED